MRSKQWVRVHNEPYSYSIAYTHYTLDVAQCLCVLVNCRGLWYAYVTGTASRYSRLLTSTQDDDMHNMALSGRMAGEGRNAQAWT